MNERPVAKPLEVADGWSRCWHCGRGTHGGTHRGASANPDVRGYVTWRKCRSKDLKEYQLTLPDPASLTDPTVQHPQMTRLAFARGPDWLDEDAPRRWGAAIVWWKPGKEYVAQVYEDGRVAWQSVFDERADADEWMAREVNRLRKQDDRVRPTAQELAALPWNADDAEDPEVPA